MSEGKTGEKIVWILVMAGFMVLICIFYVLGKRDEQIVNVESKTSKKIPRATPKLEMDEEHLKEWLVEAGADKYVQRHDEIIKEIGIEKTPDANEKPQEDKK